MTDPNPVDDPRTVQLGSALTPATGTTKTWQTCTVLEVYPNQYSCDVQLQDGRRIGGLPWPGLDMNPNGSSGTVKVPWRGQVMSLHTELQSPYLSTVVPQLTSSATASWDPVEHKVMYEGSSTGGYDPVYANMLPSNDFRGCMPRDINPGDWVTVGSQGNMLGCLEGGVVMLKASEMAKVVATQAGDLLRLFGRNIDILSDFGTVKFSSHQGHVSMALNGGSHQLTECSPSEDKFTIHLDMGTAGDLVNFRLTNPGGHLVGQVHYRPDGSVETVNAGEDAIVNGFSSKLIRGNNETQIIGYKHEDIKGPSTELVWSKLINASGEVTVTGGGNVSLASAASVKIAAGKNVEILAAGIPLTPLNVSLKTIVTNGDMVVDIGNPAALSTPSSFDLTASLNVQMKASMGNFIVGKGPGQIWLGALGVVPAGAGPPLPPVYTPPFYSAAHAEPIKDALNQILYMLAYHTHKSNVPGADTSPAFYEGLPAQTSDPFAAATLATWDIPSKFIRLGI